MSFNNLTIDALDAALAHVYLLNEQSGTRADSIGNALDLGDNNTVLYAAGKSGNCADFEANNSEYLKNANSAFTSCTSVICSLWLNLESSPGAGDNPVIFYESYTANAGNARVSAYIPAGTSKIAMVWMGKSATSTNSFSTGQWYHVVCVFDSGADTLEMYVNGSKTGWIDSSPGAYGAIEATASASGLLVGGGTSFVSKYDGLIDEMYFWLNALPANTQTFVDALYNSGDGRFWTADVTPPGVPTGASYSEIGSGSSVYGMDWVEPADADFSHCELRKTVGGTDYYLAKVDSLPSWGTSSSPAAWWKIAENLTADEQISGWMDDSGDAATAYYVRSKDTSENASIWVAITFQTSADPDDIIDTAGGNWVVSNLTTALVVAPTTYGPGGALTGTAVASGGQAAAATALAIADSADGVTWRVQATTTESAASIYLYNHATDALVAIVDADGRTKDLTAGQELYAKIVASNKTYSDRYPAAAGVTVPSLAAVAAPGKPTLSLANDLTGTSFTATVAGLTGSDYRALRYRAVDGTTWTDFPALVDQQLGNGTIQVTGLAAGGYVVEAYGRNSAGYGPGSARAFVEVASSANAATGGVNVVIEAVRDMLAATDAWQTWTGAEQAEARTHTYNGAVDGPSTGDRAAALRAKRPLAVVYVEGDFAYQRTAAGTTDTYAASGVVHVGIDADFPDGYGDATAMEAGEVWFNRTLSGVIEDLRALAGTPGYLTLREVAIESGPVAIEEGSYIPTGETDPVLDVFMRVVLRLSFGAA